KTHKTIYLKDPFKSLVSCPYSKYVLQFSHYQMMIERMTRLQVEERWCIWLSEDNIVEGYDKSGNGWVQYNTPNYSKMLYNHFANPVEERITSLKQLKA